MDKIENNMYYQTGIKTSRNEDSVYAMKYASQQMMIDKLQKENKKLKEDISFCLKSIKQEMEMSTDSRTKQEMLSCYQILSEWSDK